MVVTLTSLTPRLSSHTQLFMLGLRSASQRESGDHTTPSILVQLSVLCTKYVHVYGHVNVYPLTKYIQYMCSNMLYVHVCMYILNLSLVMSELNPLLLSARGGKTC